MRQKTMKELMNSYLFRLYEHETTQEKSYEVYKRTGEPVESFEQVEQAVQYIQEQERDKHTRVLDNLQLVSVHLTL